VTAVEARRQAGHVPYDESWAVRAFPELTHAGLDRVLTTGHMHRSAHQQAAAASPSNYYAPRRPLVDTSAESTAAGSEPGEVGTPFPSPPSAGQASGGEAQVHTQVSMQLTVPAGSTNKAAGGGKAGKGDGEEGSNPRKRLRLSVLSPPLQAPHGPQVGRAPNNYLTAEKLAASRDKERSAELLSQPSRFVRPLFMEPPPVSRAPGGPPLGMGVGTVDRGTGGESEPTSSQMGTDTSHGAGKAAAVPEHKGSSRAKAILAAASTRSAAPVSKQLGKAGRR
jgi:hypothetical protein